MIKATIQSLLGGGVFDITVVTGHRATELIPELNRLGVRHVHNPDYQNGMFSSVVTGVQSLSRRTEAFFMLPCDMPLVQGHTIHLLRDAYHRTLAPVVYPVFLQRRGHPPLITGRLCPEITSWSRPEGLRSLLALYDTQACEVQTADEGILMDVDTPEDYALVRHRFSQSQFAAADNIENQPEAEDAGDQITDNSQGGIAEKQWFDAGGDDHRRTDNQRPDNDSEG